MVKILIVDDSQLMRDLISRHISTAFGYEVIQAEDGAIEMAARHSPDLILMDLIMPRLDGISAIRELRRNARNDDLPIIFLSAETDRRKWVEAFKAGANDFISKPYQKNELLARIGAHLKIALLTREMRQKNALLEREQYLASVVQRQLLPQRLDFEGFDIFNVYQAQEQIGGDFFDAWEDEGRIIFVMADISGHGASSALLMAMCKGLLYSLAKDHPEPVAAVAKLNALLYAMMDEGGLDMFVTMAYVAVDRSRNEAVVVSAGHAPVYVIREDGPEAIGATGPALGLTPQFDWKAVATPFQVKDTLFLLTDGLTELRSPQGEFFGEERLRALLRRGVCPRDMIGEIIEIALPFCKGVINDDLAMLAALRTD